MHSRRLSLPIEEIDSLSSKVKIGFDLRNLSVESVLKLTYSAPIKIEAGRKTYGIAFSKSINDVLGNLIGINSV
jgi:hypothetical protein